MSFWVIIRVDDSDFSGAQFAKISDQCGKWHSLSLSAGAFAQQECFPDLAMFEKLGRKMFATETRGIDEVDDSVEFSLTGCTCSKYNVADFLDGAQ